MSLSHESVKEYYGKVLENSEDLKTDACCIDSSPPLYQRAILSRIHTEVMEKFYGCGSPIPKAIEGKQILDLGSGSGRDVFLLAALAGKNAKVTGIDMTDEQLKVAREHREFHIKEFGLKDECIEFHKSYIENLKEHIPDSSIDVVTSNCVINLSPDKEAVFKEIFRTLKPGGELYFSDIFASRRLPKDLEQDSILVGECLGGALYTEDFRRMMIKNGVHDFRTMSTSPLTVNDPAIIEQLGEIKFYSQTVRAFKLDLEDQCEDYGQVATYKGGIAHSESAFLLDDHHLFEKDRPMLVCGNTADMLSMTRFSKYFDVSGDKSKHFGIFDCSADDSKAVNTGAACC